MLLDSALEEENTTERVEDEGGAAGAVDGRAAGADGCCWEEGAGGAIQTALVFLLLFDL